MPSKYLKYILMLLSLNCWGQFKRQIIGSWEFVNCKVPAAISKYSSGKDNFVLSFYDDGNFQSYRVDKNPAWPEYDMAKWKVKKNKLILGHKYYIDSDSSFVDSDFGVTKLTIKKLTDSILVLYGDTTQDGYYLGDYTYRKISQLPYKNLKYKIVK